MSGELRTVDLQVLSCRLILALLLEDQDESDDHVEGIRIASGLTRNQFQIAWRSAWEAAYYWKQRGQAEQARTGLLERIEEFVDMAARV